jgi:hypothetical protein
MKRKFIPLLLSAMLILSLSACGGGSSSASDTGSSAPAATEDVSTDDAVVEEELAEEEPVEEEPPAPLDLTGDWHQTNSNSETSYQDATITGDTIEVYWIDEEGDSKSLYWAGTYIAPTDAVDDYSWDSSNDKSKTDTALLASGDDTKTFTYKNGVISYSVSALGETMTVELSRQ